RNSYPRTVSFKSEAETVPGCFRHPVPTRKSPGGPPPGLGSRARRPAGKLLTTSSGRSGEKRSLESPWVLLFRASSARPENQDVPSEQNPQAQDRTIFFAPVVAEAKLAAP